MSAQITPAGAFLSEVEHDFRLAWWTSLRLRDCDQLVYQHGVVVCPCRRSLSEAYSEWRQQNPDAATAHDQRMEGP